jgi:hypothetical protein
MNISERLDRRDLLRSAGQVGAGLIGAGALAAMTASPVAASSSDNNGDDTQHGIVGAWIDDVTPNGTVGVPHQVITLYTPGGGVSGEGNLDGRSVYGVWAQTGDREFAITFLGYAFTPQGALAGTLKVRIKATLGPGNDHMTGQALVAFSQDGTTFFTTGTTTFTSRRIKVEPI